MAANPSKDNPILLRLHEVLEEKRARNPRFGLRALARQLGIAAPVLSRILGGQRSLTIQMARRIVRALTDHPGERQRLLKAFALDPKAAPAKATRYRYLTLAELERLSHWGHSAILEVLRGEHGIRSVETIARAAGLGEDVAERLLGDLESLKLVQRSLKRGWHTQGHHLSSIRWEGEAPWRQVHAGYAERAAEYVRARHDASEASVQGITMLVAPERIAEARARLQELSEEIADELARQGPEGRPRRLYRLNVQLFPLGRKPPPG